MDPLTLTLVFAMAAGWFVRNAVEDGLATWRGRESPRIARRRARHDLDLARQRAGDGPTIGQAVTGRVAHRIANPPDRHPALEYLALRWADAWDEATERHNDRVRRRAIERARAADAERDDPAGPRDRTDYADIHDAEEVDQPPPDDDRDGQPDESTGRPHRWACQKCGAPADGLLCDDCLGLNRPRPEPEPDDRPGDTSQTPGPLPDQEPVTTRKDPPVSTPNTINGDVGSPTEALAFCAGALDLNTAVVYELATATDNLRGEGVGEDFLAILEQARDAVGGCSFAVDGARTLYADHVAAQADLLSDPDLRDTVTGYLSADRA